MDIEVTPISGTTRTDAEQSLPTTDIASQDTFLQLLVAQLSNQDPLNPVEGAAFVSQLAEFSSLEQLSAIRQGIELLTESSDSNTE